MRRHYLDNIRWITILTVVLYHVIYMYNGVQLFGVIGPFHERQFQDAFLYLVYPWFMTLLFVVSGMSARYYLENHTAKEFLRTRTRKLLIPSTLGLFVFHWTVGYYNMQISHAFETLPQELPFVIKYLIMSVSGTGVLWYIQMLWIFSLLLVFVRKFEKGKLYQLGAKAGLPALLLFTVLIYLSAQVLNTPMITVYRFGIYGTGFLIGYFVMAHEEVTDRLAKYWCPLLASALALGIAYTVIYFGENYAVEPFINNIMACVYCWIAVLAVFAATKRWYNRTSAFAGWMRQKSWGLYVFHYLPLAAAAYYLKEYAWGMPVFLCYVLVGIAAYMGAYVLNEVISRIPVIRYFVLGIRKTKQK